MVNFEKQATGMPMIVIQLPGEKEDYTILFRTLISMMGRLNKDRLLDSDELYIFGTLLENMAPEPEQLCIKH